MIARWREARKESKRPCALIRCVHQMGYFRVIKSSANIVTRARIFFTIVVISVSLDDFTYFSLVLWTLLSVECNPHKSKNAMYILVIVVCSILMTIDQ